MSGRIDLCTESAENPTFFLVVSMSGDRRELCTRMETTGHSLLAGQWAVHYTRSTYRSPRKERYSLSNFLLDGDLDEYPDGL